VPSSTSDIESRYRAIFDQTFQFIALLRAHDGTIVEANPSSLSFRGLKMADVAGKKLWETAWFDIAFETQRLVKRAVEQAAAGEATRIAEVDLLNAEGDVATYEFAFTPVRDDAGQVTTIIAEGRDITPRKRVEDALRRARDELELRVQNSTAELRDSEAKARAILNTAVDAIITIDERAIVESLNPAAEDVFGYKASEVIGRNVSMLMPEPYHSEHDDYMRNYLRTGRAKIIGIGREVVGRRKDGSTFPMELAVSEVQLGEGHAGSRIFTGIVRDITERRRLEQEIIEISGSEQRRIGQDLHDGLGQQLTGIALLSRVLSDELAANKSKQAAAAAKIAELVQEAISWTRYLSRGLSPIGLDAKGLPSALTELARHTSDVLGIRCDLVCPPAVRVNDEATAMHLYRIAQEAVSNAIKHGKAKRIAIKLSTARGRTILSITDNGVGIRPSSNGSTNSKGMGIATMHYRARLMGATLKVEKGARGGTTVTCTLDSNIARGRTTNGRTSTKTQITRARAGARPRRG
jgi:PAS domain S-box-containing protein